MTERRKMLFADIALLLVALCWGGGFVAGDMAAERFPTFFIMTVRFGSAALLIGILFLRQIRNCSRKDWQAGLILGILFAIAQSMQVLALKYTTPSKQAFLVTTYVMIVPFVSWLIFKQRPPKKSFFMGLLTLIGIGLISFTDQIQNIALGDILTLGFAIIYSFIIVFTGIFARQSNPIAMSFFQFVTTGVLCGIATLLTHSIPKIYPPAGIGALAYLVIINTVLGFTLQNVAQKYTSDTHAALLLSTESVFGYLCGVVLYHDPFTPKVLLGGMIVFSAVLLSIVNWKEILHKA